jgi:hypothetical protein
MKLNVNEIKLKPDDEKKKQVRETEGFKYKITIWWWKTS